MLASCVFVLILVCNLDWGCLVLLGFVPCGFVGIKSFWQ